MIAHVMKGYGTQNGRVKLLDKCELMDDGTSTTEIKRCDKGASIAKRNKRNCGEPRSQKDSGKREKEVETWNL